MKNMQIKTIYVFDTAFHFYYVETETSRIKFKKLRIRINNKNQVVISHKKCLRSIQNCYSKVSFFTDCF